MSYKWCAVRECKNTTLKTPDKLFVSVPKNAEKRKKWLEVAHRNVKDIQPKTAIYICEDHFNLEEDMENYMQYKIMGSVKHIRMKPTAVPSRLDYCPIRKEHNTPESNESTKIVEIEVPQEAGSTKLAEVNTDNEMNTMARCRACLQANQDMIYYELFGEWPEHYVMNGTIAFYLTNIVGVEINYTPDPVLLICEECCNRLHDIYLFIKKVKTCDQAFKVELKSKEIWPQPIEVNKNLDNDVEVQVKQEVISDEDVDFSIDRQESVALDCDIKIEPEELVLPHIKVTVNGTITNEEMEADTETTDEIYCNEEYLDDGIPIKEEPISDNEEVPDMPLECLLCTKTFHRMSGLKAHVIAYHSYKGVKRKLGDQPSPVKQLNNQVCGTCKRKFSTRTELMVHGTTHGSATCYGCGLQLPSFERLVAHRKRCVASPGATDTVRALVNVMRNASSPEAKETPTQIVNKTEIIKIERVDSPESKQECMTDMEIPSMEIPEVSTPTVTENPEITKPECIEEEIPNCTESDNHANRPESMEEVRDIISIVPDNHNSVNATVAAST